ncbi:MAG: RidA family protein [Cyanobacteria bacterium J06627_28]
MQTLKQGTPSVRKIIKTDKAPAPVGPYNQGIVAAGAMLFVAGQIPLDAATGELVGTTVAEQTEKSLQNLAAVVEAAGSDFSQVVKTSVFLKDMNDFAAMNEVYAKHFGDESAPARACVEVARLPKDVLVEIECIAVVPE